MNRVGAALLACALILLVFVVLVFRSAAENSALQDAEADRIHEIIDTAQTTLSAMKDAETGLRGFVITGKEIYLEPFNSGAQTYAASLATLRRLTAADPHIHPLVEKFAVIAKRKLDGSYRGINLVRAHKDEELAALIRTGQGKVNMDKMRALTRRIVVYEEAAHRTNTDQIARTQRATRRWVMIAAALLFLLTLTGTVLLQKEIRAGRELAASLEASEKKYRDLAASLEEQVKDRTRELQQINQELSAFAYSVSHDLRAPLRSIDGFSQMVLEDYSQRLDQTGIDLLNRVRAAAKRMGQLIQSLLELSQVTRRELHRERVSLSAVARTVADSLEAAFPNRAVTLCIAPDLETEGDPHLLRVVLDNLLSNAWKFTSKNDVALVEVGSQARQLGAPASEDVFFVRDNGSGFDPAYSSRLFTPFQRLHSEKEFEGTGIGLATVKRVVHRHGGKIWAESKPGEGATFFFSL